MERIRSSSTTTLAGLSLGLRHRFCKWKHCSVSHATANCATFKCKAQYLCVTAKFFTPLRKTMCILLDRKMLVYFTLLLYRYWWNTRIFPFAKKSYLHRAQRRYYFYLSRVRILVSPWLRTWLANYKRASRSGVRPVLLKFHSQNGFEVRRRYSYWWLSRWGSILFTSLKNSTRR